MKQERRLSFLRVIWTDYPAFYAALVPVVSWIVYIAWTPDWRGQGPVIKPEMRPIFLALAIIASTTGLLVVSPACTCLPGFFAAAPACAVRLTISSSSAIMADRMRVHLRPPRYLSSTAVHRNAQTKALKSGEHVTLLVDRTKPSRAFIRDLYIRR